MLIRARLPCSWPTRRPEHHSSILVTISIDHHQSIDHFRPTKGATIVACLLVLPPPFLSSSRRVGRMSLAHRANDRRGGGFGGLMPPRRPGELLRTRGCIARRAVRYSGVATVCGGRVASLGACWRLNECGVAAATGRADCAARVRSVMPPAVGGSVCRKLGGDGV